MIKYISKIVLEKQKKKYTIESGQAGVASRIKKLFIFPYLDTGRIHRHLRVKTSIAHPFKKCSIY